MQAINDQCSKTLKERLMKKWIVSTFVYIFIFASTAFAQTTSIKCPTCDRINEPINRFCFNCGIHFMKHSVLPDSLLLSKKAGELTVEELETLIGQKVAEELSLYRLPKKKSVTNQRKQKQLLDFIVVSVAVTTSFMWIVRQ